jgi:WD40 repeat protein
MNDHRACPNESAPQEEIVTVDYVLAVAPPEPKGTSTQPDWISTFDNHMRAFVKHARATKGLGKAMLIPFGSYDKVLHNMYRGIEGQEDINAVGHEQPITGLSSYVETEGTITMASSSQDETVRVWSLNLQTNKAKCNFLGVGHEGAVESVEISPDGRVLASSGWDSTIKLWALKEDDDDEEMPDPAKGRDSKRAKHKEKETGPKELKCRSTLTGHTQSASVVRWISQEQLVTGSWDHSVRFWDVASGVNTNTLVRIL